MFSINQMFRKWIASLFTLGVMDGMKQIGFDANPDNDIQRELDQFFLPNSSHAFVDSRDSVAHPMAIETTAEPKAKSKSKSKSKSKK